MLSFVCFRAGIDVGTGDASCGGVGTDGGGDRDSTIMILMDFVLARNSE